MPELPEVESVRRLLDSVLVGRKISSVVVVPDSIVFEGDSEREIPEFVVGHQVLGTGRKGKIFWLEFSNRCLFGHLGMSGWVRELEMESEKRLVSHGKAPLDEPTGVPRFLKLLLEAEDGGKAALTDGRRLARIWVGDSPETDRRIVAMGPDAFLNPPSPEELHRRLRGRKGAIKSLLLDQSLFAGVGNWVADEVLFHSRIAPQRETGSLSEPDWRELTTALAEVLRIAVEAEADDSRFPKGWLFSHRWGGRHGSQEIDGHEIRRDKVGGRTSAWVPSLQK